MGALEESLAALELSDAAITGAGPHPVGKSWDPRPPRLRGDPGEHQPHDFLQGNLEVDPEDHRVLAISTREGDDPRRVPRSIGLPDVAVDDVLPPDPQALAVSDSPDLDPSLVENDPARS